MRPMIGITPAVNQREGLGEVFSVHTGYVVAVVAAGGYCLYVTVEGIS